MRVLDDVLPVYDFSSRHSIHVDATPERTRVALEQTDAGSLPLTRILMGVRGLPARIRGRRAPGGTAADPFVELRRTEYELALGIAGQFWTPAARIAPIADAAAFQAFDEPGNARAAMGFAIVPEGTGSRLDTETRIQPIDAAARRSFGRYWLLIRAGSGLIRRDMLRAVKRRAERPLPASG
jgi:hypothetical protein